MSELGSNVVRKFTCKLITYNVINKEKHELLDNVIGDGTCECDINEILDYITKIQLPKELRNLCETEWYNSLVEISNEYRQTIESGLLYYTKVASYDDMSYGSNVIQFNDVVYSLRVDFSQAKV